MMQLIPIISTAIFGGLLLYFRNLVSPEGQVKTLAYYLYLFAQPLKELGVWLAVIILMGLAVYLAYIFIRSSFRNADLRTLMLGYLRKLPGFLKTEAGFFIKYAVPAILSLILLSFILSYINQINSVNLKDEVLIKADLLFTGVYPYFYLSSLFSAGWFSYAVIIFFKNLTTIVIIAAAYIFLKNKQIFKKFSISFCLALLFMLPLWLTFPALSPHDRLIDNVYNLPISAAVSEEIADYNPNTYIKQFLAKMRTKKEDSNLPYLPTSTMPSAHVVWAMLAGFYLFKTKTGAGIICLPALLLSSFGTVFLAQHYLIDIFGGMAVGALAIIFPMRYN